jgi:hypothetical protein
VDERHEDCESRPAEDARLPDYVRHSRIMNARRRTCLGHGAAAACQRRRLFDGLV